MIQKIGLIGLCMLISLISAAAALGQTHAPWPSDWNNWNDPALWVTVGNPGNANDTRWTAPNRHGAVDHAYQIGKFEVTAGQYTSFLNAVAKTDTYGLYDSRMANYVFCNIQQSGTSGSFSYSVDANSINRPVIYVSWGDAARYINWLSNNQPSGPQSAATTEDGSYFLNGATNSQTLLTVTKKSSAKYYIPTLDEWYKAAFYDPTKAGGPGYWLYATGTDATPGGDVTEATRPGNNMNFSGSGAYPIDGVNRTNIAGDFQLSDSYYGTFDQGGNVVEWTDTIDTHNLPHTNNRELFGGSFAGWPCNSGSGASYPAESGDWCAGFRIATTVPEPESLVLLGIGALTLASILRFRK